MIYLFFFKDCPKLSQVTEEDINSYFSHKSTPVMLAAKEAHKKMLKKQKSKWFEQLMNNSDSDDDDDDNANYQNDNDTNENTDQLNIKIKNLNLNTITNNYYTITSSQTAINKKSQYVYSDELTPTNKRNIVSKRQRNDLKTNNLSKSVKHMMRSTPNQSRIWNINLTEDNSKSVYSKKN
jgi:hypothetical protein